MPLPPSKNTSQEIDGNHSIPDFEAVDRIIANLSEEFRIDAVDKLGELSNQVSRALEGKADPELLSIIRRETHNLKGLGASYGYPAITVISQRLENYLTDVEALDDHRLSDMLPFFDRMQDIADSGENPSDEALRLIVRSLPAKVMESETKVVVSNLEVLLVASSRILGRAVEGQLIKRGYRVVTVKSPLEIFETAVRTRPDMIIASAMMDGLNGIDLARALKAMSVTQSIRFVLLTSFEADNPILRACPQNVALLRHDRDLDAEMSQVIEKFDWATQSV